MIYVKIKNIIDVLESNTQVISQLDCFLKNKKKIKNKTFIF